MEEVRLEVAGTGGVRKGQSGQKASPSRHTQDCVQLSVGTQVADWLAGHITHPSSQPL